MQQKAGFTYSMPEKVNISAKYWLQAEETDLEEAPLGAEDTTGFIRKRGMVEEEPPFSEHDALFYLLDCGGSCY